MRKTRTKTSKHVVRIAHWSTGELERGVEEYARQAGWSLEFVRLWLTPPEDVLPYIEQLQPDGLLVCGTPAPIRGRLCESVSVPVVEIAGQTLGTGRPGAVTRTLMDAYADYCARSAVRAVDA